MRYWNIAIVKTSRCTWQTEVSRLRNVLWWFRPTRRTRWTPSFSSARWEIKSNLRKVFYQFGDGVGDTVWPSKVEVVEELVFAGLEGELMVSSGLSFSSQGDLRYTSSSVRMVYARMWDVNKFEEGTRWMFFSQSPPAQVPHLASALLNLPEQLPAHLPIHHSCYQGCLQWGRHKVPDFENSTWHFKKFQGWSFFSDSWINRYILNPNFSNRNRGLITFPPNKHPPHGMFGGLGETIGPCRPWQNTQGTWRSTLFAGLHKKTDKKRSLSQHATKNNVKPPKDGDNNLDICLDMGEAQDVLQVNFWTPFLTLMFLSSGGFNPDTALWRGEPPLSTKGETFWLFARSGGFIFIFSQSLSLAKIGWVHIYIFSVSVSCQDQSFKVLLSADQGWGTFMKAWLHSSNDSEQYCIAS